MKDLFTELLITSSEEYVGDGKYWWSVKRALDRGKIHRILKISLCSCMDRVLKFMSPFIKEGTAFHLSNVPLCILGSPTCVSCWIVHHFISTFFKLYFQLLVNVYCILVLAGIISCDLKIIFYFNTVGFKNSLTNESRHLCHLGNMKSMFSALYGCPVSRVLSDCIKITFHAS